MTQRTTHEPGSVTTQVADGVGSVTFGHPKGNSLPAGLLAELAARITALGREPEARVIVLRSEGPGAFCAGASFAELSAIADVESGTRFFLGFANLINAMRECPKLILARVHGKVVGEIATAARPLGIPVIVLAGQVSVDKSTTRVAGIMSALAMSEYAGSVRLALADAANQLMGLASETAARLGNSGPSGYR